MVSRFRQVDAVQDPTSSDTFKIAIPYEASTLSVTIQET